MATLSKSDLANKVSRLIADNTEGNVTVADVRTVLNDILDSEAPADWDVTRQDDPAFIKNKPTIPNVESWAEQGNNDDIPLDKLGNVPSAGLNQSEVDARVAAGVADWAEQGNNDDIPLDKLGNVPPAGLNQSEVDARVAAGVADWAEQGNNDDIPASKLGNVPPAGLNQSEVDARVAAGVADWAEEGDTSAIPAAKLTQVEGLNQSEVDARVAAGVADWAEQGNDTIIPDDKLPVSQSGNIDAFEDRLEVLEGVEASFNRGGRIVRSISDGVLLDGAHANARNALAHTLVFTDDPLNYDQIKIMLAPQFGADENGNPVYGATAVSSTIERSDLAALEVTTLAVGADVRVVGGLGFVYGRTEAVGALGGVIHKTGNSLEYLIGTPGADDNTGHYDVIGVYGIRRTTADVNFELLAEANYDSINDSAGRLLWNAATNAADDIDIRTFPDWIGFRIEQHGLHFLSKAAILAATGSARDLVGAVTDIPGFEDLEPNRITEGRYLFGWDATNNRLLFSSSSPSQEDAMPLRLYRQVGELPALDVGVVDARVAAGVADWAKPENDDDIPASKLGNAPSGGLDVSNLEESDIPERYVGYRTEVTPATYAATVMRRLELVANVESSTTMRLAIADERGFGAATVGGGALVLRKLASNTNRGDPDTFRIVYLGLNNSGQHVLVQTDSPISFDPVGSITVTSSAGRGVFGLNFNAFNFVVQFDGVQTAFTTVSNALAFGVFQGTTPIEVVIGVDGYEIQTAPEVSRRVPVSAPIREIPEAPEIPTLPSVIERVDALPLDDGSKQVLWLNRDWTSTEVRPRIHFVEADNNLYYSEGIVQPDLAGQRLGSKEGDPTNKIYGIRINLTSRQMWIAIEKDYFPRGDTTLFHRFFLDSTTYWFSTEEDLGADFVAGGKTYALLKVTLNILGGFGTLPATTLGTNVFRAQVQYSPGNVDLFTEGRVFPKGLYEYGGFFWEREEDEEDIKKVSKLPATTEQKVVYLLANYTTGHAGFDFNIGDYSQAVRQIDIVGNNLYSIDQSLNRVIVTDLMTHQRQAALEVATPHSSPSGIRVSSSHIYIVDSSDKSVGAFRRDTLAADTREGNKFDLSGMSIPIGIVDLGGHTLIGDFTQHKLFAFTSSSGRRDATRDWTNLDDHGIPSRSIADLAVVTNVLVSYRKTGSTVEAIDYDPQLETAASVPNGDGEYNLATNVLYILAHGPVNKAFAFLTNRIKLPGAYDIDIPLQTGEDPIGIAADGAYIYVSEDFHSRFFVFNKTNRTHEANNLRLYRRGFYEAQDDGWLHRDIPAAGTAQGVSLDATAIRAVVAGQQVELGEELGTAMYENTAQTRNRWQAPVAGNINLNGVTGLVAVEVAYISTSSEVKELRPLIGWFRAENLQRETKVIGDATRKLSDMSLDMNPSSFFVISLGYSRVSGDRILSIYSDLRTGAFRITLYRTTVA